MALVRITAGYPGAWALAAVAAICLAAPSALAGTEDSPIKSEASAPLSGQKLALFGFGESKPKPPPAPKKEGLACPRVSVQAGTAAYALYERGREGEPLAVRYQVRFGEFARECVDLGAEVGIRIGLSARALVGPLGKPGHVMDVPIRFVVLDENRKVVVSQVTRLQISIPAGQNGVTFTHVEELGVPMPANRLKGWDFRVGFDTKPPASPQG